MVFIYILELEKEHYYVGKTENPDIRITDHFNDAGSEWTKRYPPVKVVDIIPNCDAYDEDKYTKIYMDKYGIDNVRGGSFCMVKLSHEIKKTIQYGIDSVNDRCYNCHTTGHFTSKCTNNTSKLINDESVVCLHCSKSIVSDNYSKHLSEYCDQLPIYNKNKSLLKNITILGKRILKNTVEPKCNRCGHHGHLAPSCYAKRIVPEKYTNIW